jgi:hypothetical protein
MKGPRRLLSLHPTSDLSSDPPLFLRPSVTCGTLQAMRSTERAPSPSLRLMDGRIRSVAEGSGTLGYVRFAASSYSRRY